MLKLKLKEVLIALGKKNPQAWLVDNCAFNYSKTHKLLTHKQKSISFEDLGEICLALNCTPDELFYWENASKNPLSEEHSLVAKLTKPGKDYNWMERIKGLNQDGVERLMKRMIQLESEKQQEGQKIFDEDRMLKKKAAEDGNL